MSLIERGRMEDMYVVAKDNVEESEEMRLVAAQKILEWMDKDPNIVQVEADMGAALGSNAIREKYPDRFVECGIAEGAQFCATAGLALSGLKPFVHTFACFASRRACDMIYISLGFAQMNAKILGSEAGVNSRVNGGTHMGREDIALLRPVPNITIIEVCDNAQMRWAIQAAIETKGLFYIRMARRDTHKIYEEGSLFEIGKSAEVIQGNDVSILASGNLMVYEAILAARKLKEDGITARVIDMYSIKPLDIDCIKRCAAETGAIVTAENHALIGGLGSAVAETIMDHDIHVALRRIGIGDEYGVVGQLQFLKERFHLTADDIVKATKEAIGVKSKAQNKF